MTQALRLTAARYRLGTVVSQDLVDAAVAAMVCGLESEALVLLAGDTDPRWTDAAPLFERALEELGIPIPSIDAACWMVLRPLIARIASGEVDPLAGVQAILDQVYYPGDLHDRSTQCVGDSHDLQHMLGAFYQVDDLEEGLCGNAGARRARDAAVAATKAEIRDLAARWLRDHPD